MAHQTSQYTKSGEKWPRSDVFELLCTLNSNIDKIASPNANPDEEEMKAIMAQGTLLLCELVQFPSSDRRIASKIRQLWRTLGNQDGRDEPYDIYNYGAFTMTLPDLDTVYPGMLDEISEEVSRRQVATSFHESNSRISAGSRKSTRPGTRNDYGDPILCRCGFTHHMTTVHCDNCYSWQHSLCYYNTRAFEDIPELHLCDQCQSLQNISDDMRISMIETTSLGDAMARLDVGDSHEISPHESRMLKQFQKALKGLRRDELGPFAFPQDDNFFWGPTNDEIQKSMKRICCDIEDISHILLHAGFSIRKTRKAMNEDGGINLMVCLRRTHGKLFEQKFIAALVQQTDSANRVVHIINSMVTSIIIDLAFYGKSTNEGNVSTLLYCSMCEGVLEVNGPTVLRQLRRKTLLDVLDKNGQSLNNAISDKAKHLSPLVLQALCGMLGPESSAKSLPEALKLSSLEKAINNAFKKVFRLKFQLALSERFYEVYTIPINTKASSELMVTLDGTEVKERSSIDVCLIPAIIEYESESLGRSTSALLVSPIDDILIRATPETRRNGSLICPAVVTVL